MTPRQARILQRHAPDVDGHAEVCTVLWEIVTALFPAKDDKKKPPRTRADALTQRFGSIELPPTSK